MIKIFGCWNNRGNWIRASIIDRPKTVCGIYTTIVIPRTWMFFHPEDGRQVFCPSPEEAKDAMDKALIDMGWVLCNSKEEEDKYRLLI